MHICKPIFSPNQIKASIIKLSKKSSLGINISTQPSKKRKKRKYLKAFNQGKWSESEHSEFLKAFKIYGNDWKNIERKIKFRSSIQIRSHTQKRLMKLMEKYNIDEVTNKMIKKALNYNVKQKIEDDDKPFFEAFRIFSFKKIFEISKIPKEHSIKKLCTEFLNERNESIGVYSHNKNNTNYSNIDLFLKKDEYLTKIKQQIIRELINITNSINEILYSFYKSQYIILEELNYFIFARLYIQFSKDCYHIIERNNSFLLQYTNFIKKCSDLYSGINQ